MPRWGENMVPRSFYNQIPLLGTDANIYATPEKMSHWEQRFTVRTNGTQTKEQFKQEYHKSWEKEQSNDSSMYLCQIWKPGFCCRADVEGSWSSQSLPTLSLLFQKTSSQDNTSFLFFICVYCAVRMTYVLASVGVCKCVYGSWCACIHTFLWTWEVSSQYHS